MTGNLFLRFEIKDQNNLARELGVDPDYLRFACAVE